MSSSKLDNFSIIKNIIENQILNTLDFLFTDNQIDEIKVVKIARYILKNIDSTKSTSDLFKQIRLFVNKYPLFKENLSKTIIALNKSYAN